jgi:integrase
MASWALVTGMRRKELCALAVDQVPDTAWLDMDEHPLIGVALTITSDKPRRSIRRSGCSTPRIAISTRSALVRRLRHADRTYRAPDTLFLNTRGRPVSCARFTAAMQAASTTAGVIGTGHWLRHTFAMTMLARLQVQARTTPEINSKVVQVLLGHSSIASTAIYLRCVEMLSAELRKASPISTARLSTMARRAAIDRRLAPEPADTMVAFLDPWGNATSGSIWTCWACLLT